MKLNVLKFIGFFAAIVLFAVACDQEAFEEFSSVPADAAPTLSVTIDSNTDSAMVVSYSINVPGRVTLAVVPATVDTPTIAEIELRSIDGSVTVDYFKHDTEVGSGTVSYTDLLPYTQYRVMAIAHNTDGVASDLFITDFIRTQDYASPILDDYAPQGRDPLVDSNQPIVLTFSEPVLYDNTKALTFSSYFNAINEVIPEDSITINGNEVVITYGILPFNDYCFVSYPEGAFTDRAGNVCEEVISGVIGGYLEGIWFRVETDPAQNLEKIFENFLGDYNATEYAMDSTTVDWGPYSVTIAEDEDETTDYGIIISNFFDVGADVQLELNTDGTVFCPNQYLYHSSTYDLDIWVSHYTNSGSIVEHTYGEWDYTDFGIAMSFTTYVPNAGYWADLYITFDKVTGKTNVQSNGKPASYDPFK